MKRYSYHGKTIQLHDDGITCNEIQFAATIEKLNLVETLGYLSRISAAMYSRQKDKEYWNSIGINYILIIDFAQYIIRHIWWNDKQPFRDDIVIDALRKFLYFRETKTNNITVAAQLRPSSYAQFPYNEDIGVEVGRNLIIYTELWNTVEKAKKYNVTNAIKLTTGLNLEGAFCLVFGFTQQTLKNGFARKYTDLDILKMSGKRFMTHDNQQAFLSWCGQTIEEMKSYTGKLNSFIHKPGL